MSVADEVAQLRRERDNTKNELYRMRAAYDDERHLACDLCNILMPDPGEAPLAVAKRRMARLKEVEKQLAEVTAERDALWRLLERARDSR